MNVKHTKRNTNKSQCSHKTRTVKTNRTTRRKINYYASINAKYIVYNHHR